VGLRSGRLLNGSHLRNTSGSAEPHRRYSAELKILKSGGPGVSLLYQDEGLGGNGQENESNLV